MRFIRKSHFSERRGLFLINSLGQLNNYFNFEITRDRMPGDYEPNNYR
jgi:hypothetical protein